MDEANIGNTEYTENSEATFEIEETHQYFELMKKNKELQFKISAMEKERDMMKILFSSFFEQKEESILKISEKNINYNLFQGKKTNKENYFFPSKNLGKNQENFNLSNYFKFQIILFLKL